MESITHEEVSEAWDVAHDRSLDSCADLLSRQTAPRYVRAMRARVWQLAPLGTDTSIPPEADEIVKVIQAYDVVFFNSAIVRNLRRLGWELRITLDRGKAYFQHRKGTYGPFF